MSLVDAAAADGVVRRILQQRPPGVTEGGGAVRAVVEVVQELERLGVLLLQPEKIPWCFCRILRNERICEFL